MLVKNCIAAKKLKVLPSLLSGVCSNEKHFILPLILSLSKGELSVPLWFDRLTMSGY
jgi:hypothetical protein